jgi:DNA topoisomerase-1
MDTITLDDAMVLFQLPKKLGETADGEPVMVAIGQFGPYVKYGAKYVSLKEDDPYAVTLERAIEVIEAKKVADANRLITDFGVDDIQVLNGRYGPYITDKARNARIPKDRDPKTLTLEECRAMLAAAPPRPARGRFGRRGAPAKAKAKAAAPAKEAVAAKAAAPAKAKAKAPAKAKAAAKTKTPAKAKAKSTSAAAPKAKAKASPPAKSPAGKKIAAAAPKQP